MNVRIVCALVRSTRVVVEGDSEFRCVVRYRKVPTVQVVRRRA